MRQGELEPSKADIDRAFEDKGDDIVAAMRRDDVSHQFFGKTWKLLFPGEKTKVMEVLRAENQTHKNLH
ncbi:MAG: hypothetical protein V4449_02465 [Patescibacteria group bacterium]